MTMTRHFLTTMGRCFRSPFSTCSKDHSIDKISCSTSSNSTFFCLASTSFPACQSQVFCQIFRRKVILFIPFIPPFDRYQWLILSALALVLTDASPHHSFLGKKPKRSGLVATTEFKVMRNQPKKSHGGKLRGNFPKNPIKIATREG